MRKFGMYTLLQSKRGLARLPAMALFTALLLVCALLFGAVLIRDEEESEGNSLLNVGITGDLSNSYLQLGMMAIQGFDPSSHYVSFVTLTEEEALEKLKNGELAGYLRVPSDFVNDVTHGEMPELVYVSADSPVGLGPILTNEVLSVVSTLVDEASAGILGVQDAADHLDLTDDPNALMEAINIRYVSYVLERDALYDVTYVGLSNGLSFGGFYVCALLFLVLLLMGLVCAPMMVRENASLARVAKSRGIGVIKQTVGDYIGFALPFLLLTALLTLLLVKVSASLSLPVPELRHLEYTLALRLLPVVLMVVSMQMFLYELSSHVTAGVLLSFLVSIVLAYISGCFYPSYLFPEPLRTIAAYLPGGAAFTYLGGLLNRNGGGLFGVLFYTLFFLVLTALVRALRIRKESV